jgi:hypothetical protein
MDGRLASEKVKGVTDGLAGDIDGGLAVGKER